MRCADCLNPFLLALGHGGVRELFCPVCENYIQEWV